MIHASTPAANLLDDDGEPSPLLIERLCQFAQRHLRAEGMHAVVDRLENVAAARGKEQ